MLFALLIFCCFGFNCSEGCAGECQAEMACLLCKDNYEQDGLCGECLLPTSYEEIGEGNKFYVNENGNCVEVTSFRTFVDSLPINQMNEFNGNGPICIQVNEKSLYEYQWYIPMFGNQKITQAEWLKFDQNWMQPNGFLELKIHRNNSSSPNKKIGFVAVNALSLANKRKPFASFFLNRNENDGKWSIEMNEIIAKDFYVVVFCDSYCNQTLDVSVEWKSVVSDEDKIILKIDNSTIEKARKSSSVNVELNWRNGSYWESNPCIPYKLSKVGYFSIDFKTEMKEKLIIGVNGKTHGYIGELNDSSCKQLLTQNVLNQVKVVISDEKKVFFVITEDLNDENIELYVKVICPNNCYNDESNGNCSVLYEKCVCNDGYNGDSCVEQCYYKGKWQPETNKGENQCYFGGHGCDEYCHCQEGFSLIDHHCVSNTCLSGSTEKTSECVAGEEGCLFNCSCDDDYTLNVEDHKCKLNTCGNGIKDENEECDGSSDCDKYCKCPSGFHERIFGNGCIHISTILMFTILALIVIVVIVCGLILLIFYLRRKSSTKETAISIVTQQPSHYLYISGCQKNSPSLENKYLIDSISLDFGNSNSTTNVFETRFQKIDIKNKSKNKYMMIIIHTPNNPKFVFHFTPQTLIISPKRTKTIVCFMTLFCTTKIKEMKIPYSIWFSKSKEHLKIIENLLFEKDFETWNNEDEEMMKAELKFIDQRHYFHFTVSTEAESSTHIDMDELNISDKPIAEGSMGKVYLGRYRSVPVAIKQFRWENLTEEESDELKRSVIGECELMSKLRNPFIANYMGSVTYIPQVSMVVQFFVLGSLGEYLRKERDNYLPLPYKLKMKMLSDTAKGMQFLHENNIMHLDLKPDNLLVNSMFADSACCVKITDFGTSRLFSKQFREKGLGTPLYLAPECYRDEYTFETDVYAFAIMAWEMFYQEEPYKEFKSLFEIKEYVTKGKRLGIDGLMPIELKNLVNECWKQYPSERLKFESVVEKMETIIQNANKHNDLDIGVDEEKIQKFVLDRNDHLRTLLKTINAD